MNDFRTTLRLNAQVHSVNAEIVSDRERSYLAIEGHPSAWKTSGDPWFRLVLSGRKQMRDFAHSILDHLDRTEDIVRKRSRKAKP